MSADESAFLSREELLGGLPAKRASTLLFAVEGRTAQLVLQSRQAAARFISEKAAEAKERAFLDALAQGRDLPVQPTIQDLERYAAQWASLVSPDPGLRAAVAYLISQKYIFTHRTIPGIRRALALDDTAVKQSFQSRYGFPLADIYAPDVSRLERLRWVWSSIAYRLDNLPPFWMVFALTLTETVGASILALPIALAKIGPIAGVVQLIVLGMVNVLTIASLAEAVARNGNVRYGNAYFGRVVADYLGSAGAVILTLALLTLSFVVLMVYDVGVSTALAGATPLPGVVWLAALFLVQFYFLYRQSLNATIASALIISAVNIGLILLIALLALPHTRLSNLMYVNLPFVNGRPFDPSILGLMFGVILTSYFGHTSTGTSARIVLSRDPSGRSLIWGALSAMLVSIALYTIWVVAVNGSVAPSILAAQTGTALTPLAAVVGPSINVFGLAFVILGMGMGSIQYSLALFNQVREWLPEPTPSEDESIKPARADLASWLKYAAASHPGRFWLAVAPTGLVFLVIEWLLANHQESFTAPLGILGTLAVPLLAGVLPMLMLVASRRKSDFIPATVFRFLGNPIVVAGIYLLFVLNFFLHGLLIWQDPFQRLLALGIGVGIVIATGVFIRRGAFTPRAVLEVRVERNPDLAASFNITACGKPLLADVRLDYGDDAKQVHAATGKLETFSQLRLATFQARLPAVRELKVWVHQISAQEESRRLPARVQIRTGAETRLVESDDSDGQTFLPIDPARDSSIQVQIKFS